MHSSANRHVELQETQSDDGNNSENSDNNVEHEPIKSAIREATDGLAMVENESHMDAATRGLITREQRIVSRRGAFKWLPVFFCNDVVHGSWWFVWGSFLAMATAVIPLVQVFYPIFTTVPGTLPILDFFATWILLIISGFFYTIGSYAFVRAFMEPHMEPLFKWRHFGTDELFGAWLFLFGTLPALPYSFIYWSLDPGNIIYMGMLFGSLLFVGACYMFVLGCYPSDKHHKQCLKPTLRVLCGRNHWILMHLQNDWLAGTWFFYYATLFALLGSFGIFWESLASNNQLEQFIYALGFVDCLMFLIGCMYFVAGSYPLDMLKVYRVKQKTSSGNENTDEAKKVKMKAMLEKAELYLHKRNQYEEENTMNLGDAENPMWGAR